MQRRTGPLFAAGILGGMIGFISALFFQEWLGGFLPGMGASSFNRLLMFMIPLMTFVVGAPAALVLLRLFDAWLDALSAREKRQRRAFEVIPLTNNGQQPSQPVLPVQALEVSSDTAVQQTDRSAVV